MQPVIGPAGHRAWAWIDPLTLLDDGRHAVFDGDCTRSPDRDGTLCVCWATASGPGTRCISAGTRRTLEGMTGQWILANRCDEEGCEAKLIDADGPGEQPVTLGASAEPIAARSRLRVTADGTLVGMGVSAAPRPAPAAPGGCCQARRARQLGVTSMPDPGRRRCASSTACVGSPSDDGFVSSIGRWTAAKPGSRSRCQPTGSTTWSGRVISSPPATRRGVWSGG